jgi:hypothetical protein
VKPVRCLFSLLSIFAMSNAFAQDKTDYTLNGEQVHFRIPPGWSAIMEKSEGDPQFAAFQVPDPTAQGTDDSANVTVKTRQLKDASAFAATVQDEFERSKAQTGYENDASNTNSGVHQYFVVRGKTKYLVRDNFQLLGTVAVEVRCQRPLLASTPAAWNTEFDNACNSVVASLKH